MWNKIPGTLKALAIIVLPILAIVLILKLF